MRVLLDTNIIIHRENKKMTNYSIGHLFRWLDKLKCEKLIHPFSKAEIARYKYTDPKEAMTLRLDAYEELRTTTAISEQVESLVSESDKTENDRVDTALLNEVFQERVDLLITEDKRLKKKAIKLGLGHRVLSINAFISYATNENPELIEYKMLAVHKKFIGHIDVHNEFFDSLREAYDGFNKWFAKKSNEEAYVCSDDINNILGFLFLKTENQDENYFDIVPQFSRKKRLKVGTFKVEATGFRLGERFIKIILDNALEQNVDEVYVTLFESREELSALTSLLLRWGFQRHGTKTSTGESVLVKPMKLFDQGLVPKQNYPALSYDVQKLILPIKSQYHTSLLPDSILRTENEVDFIGKEAHRYALQKVYISWAGERNINKGDIVLFYRMGTTTPKKYSSVLTTICVVDDIKYSFNSKEEFLAECQNRSVFTNQELESFWANHRHNLTILKFIFVKSFAKRPTLGFLWDSNIVEAPNGPRSFMQITDDQFEKITQEAQTDLSLYWR